MCIDNLIQKFGMAKELSDWLFFLSCCALIGCSSSLKYPNITLNSYNDFRWRTDGEIKRMKLEEDYWASKRLKDATNVRNGEGSVGQRGSGGDLARN